MKVDPRFLTSEGPEVFNGNELLIKGALETEGGVHLLGGYPGSPVAAFFDSMAHIKDLLDEKGIKAVMNCNEALAAAMLNGSQVVGCRSMIAMKSVGVHVAADGLAIGNLAGAHASGGAIVIYGDDPWSDSTQVPADSRYISKHLFIPVIEPSTPQEIKDFVDLAFKLSRRAELYAGFVIPTNLADGGGTVICRPNQYPAFNTNQRLDLATAAIDIDKFVLLPPRTWWQEEKLAPRFERAVVAARELGLNRLEYGADEKSSAGLKPLGFITSGQAYSYLRQVLWELGLLGQHPILKLGLTYPIDAQLVRTLAGQCRQIVVVEERRGFIEEQIGAIILKDRQLGKPSGNVQVWGKQFPGGLRGLPETRGLHPSIIIEHLAPLLAQADGRSSLAAGGAGGKTPAAPVATAQKAVQREMRILDSTAQTDVGVLPPRTPTFCPGCPHRDSADVCLEIKKRFMDESYMRRKHRRGAMDLFFHGDTGCYTMLMFPPTAPLMHDYSGMGLGGATGVGTDSFVTNKEVTFMGDGTFFHSGQLAISQAIKFGQDITFILLDNSTTAMTGHQPTSGVDYDIVGNTTPVQDIEEIIGGMAGTSNLMVVRADPEKRSQYAELLERTFLSDGVKVVIATKECGITRMRRKRRQDRAIAKRLGFLPAWQHMNVNTDICRFCLTCAEMTACPGLKHVDTDYGHKMDTDISWCVNDGACERLKACSSFELVTIKRKKPAKSRLPELGLDNIPEPQLRPVRDMWRCCLTGVGGMGIGVATSILVRAGHKDGHEVIFLDKKGLAIRNGGVISQVVYNLSHQPVTAVIPYGKADLLLGVDVLEAARALDPRGRSRIASPDRTAAVINTDKIQTIQGLMGQDDYDPAQLEKLIRRHTRSDDFMARNISRICEKYLGNKLYANIMMLGFAFQKGLIPVSMHSMAWAIKDTIRTDFRKNLYAFNMGRKLVVKPDLFQGPPQRSDWRDLLDEKCRFAIRRHGRRGQKLADTLRQMTAEAIDACEKIDEADKRAIVVRAYDCMRHSGIDYAGQYLDAVRTTCRRDLSSEHFAVTRAVIHNLASAMLYKDGPFIAELATSPEKYARDREKYAVNPANGDRIAYRHLLHSTFHIGPWSFSLDVAARGWMLRALRSMRWLRRIGAWHARDREFLRQYRQAARDFVYADGEEYRRKLQILQSPSCMDCRNPRCMEQGCPLACGIPQCLQLVYQDRWREACDLLHQTNNFPEFTSRICPAFCEDACKQGLNGFAVGFRTVESQIVDRGFELGWIQPAPSRHKSARRVAVVGSGPAGLAAAQQLARSGHQVVVFEKDDRPGGLLRYGIPGFRLAKELVDRRLAQLAAEGVTFKTSTRVGEDVSAADLLKEFDAVLLSTGASRCRDLKVPGRELSGVHFAIDFLRRCGQGRLADGGIDLAGKTVAVIGGGLTGEDCVETAVMQGARQVHQLEIMPKAPEKAGGHMDQDGNGVVRQFCVSTRKLEGRDGQVRRLRATRVQWVPSAKGPVMQEISGGDIDLSVDVVLLAMGFDPVPDDKLVQQLCLAVDDRGKVIVQDHAASVTSAASGPGIFVAGDLIHGASYVATAINSGRQAAQRIEKYLASLEP